MVAKPVIGINLEGDGSACSAFSDLLLPRWLECIGLAGAIPIVVPSLQDASDLTCVLDGLQAFVFAGCQDVDWQDGELSPEMDESIADVLLLRSIAERRLPFLGIGAGIQLLNVALGGTLCSVNRWDPTLLRHTHPHNPRHCLKTKRNSFLRAVCPDDQTPVSSLHDQAVEHVAVGFTVTATSPEGMVEAIESDSDDWLAIGIQCAPQADASDLDLRIFRAFIRRVLSREAHFAAS